MFDTISGRAEVILGKFEQALNNVNALLGPETTESLLNTLASIDELTTQVNDFVTDNRNHLDYTAANLDTLIGRLSDAADHTKDPELMTEHVRRALSMVIAQMLKGSDEAIGALAVGPRLEVALMQTFSPNTKDGGRGLEPGQLTRALDGLGRLLAESKRDGAMPPLVTPPALRVGIRRLIEQGVFL